MGRRRRESGREVNGILLLDKPTGMTSNTALQRVKRLYQARKAGHTGSLDKAASGLLPLCLGEATKFSSYLLEADKRYLARCALGIRTSTGDSLGEVLETGDIPSLDETAVDRALQKFRGEILQVPPMYSAIKHKGQRLYKLAYQGQEVERQPRPVTIHKLELKELGGDFLELDVVCSKGTYIRTLAEEIGQALGCGAHLAALRRIESGPFTADGMVELQELEKLAANGQAALDDRLLGIDAALRAFPEITLIESVVYYLCQGQAVTVPNAPTEGILRIYDNHSQFLGLGEVLDDGRITPRRLVNL